METPAPSVTPSAPAPAAAPEPAKRSRWGARIGIAVSILALLVVVMVYFGQKLMLGTKFAVSDKEAVNYSGDATEADARRLGGVLKTIGYFTGARETDVLLKRDAKEGTIVSFVLTSRWNDAEIVTAFRQIGAAIVADGLAKPITVKLLDDHLNTKNEFKVE